MPPLRPVLEDSGVAAFAEAPLFRDRHNQPLTRFGVGYILRKHVRAAAHVESSLARKRVSPDVLRHTAATHLLQEGVNLVAISRWLGHADLSTGTIHASVDMEAKRAAVEQACLVHTGDPSPAVWKTDPTELDWLDAL